MNVLLEKLENVLLSEIEVHDTMIASSKEINTALRSGDVHAVDRQRIMQDEAISKLHYLETERLDCCNTIARLLGIAAVPIRLTKLLGKVNGEWKARLEKVQEILKERIRELTTGNSSNRILIEEGLQMIENTFSLLHHTGKHYLSYGNLGQTTVASSPQSIINRIV